MLPLPEWVVQLNDELRSLAAGSAEHAFGLGCTTSLVPIVILLGLAFLLGVRHWVSLSMVALVLVMLATAWAVFVAYQAYGNGMRRAWHDTVRSAYDLGLTDREVTAEEARELVWSLLPEQAPLRRGLSGMLELESKN